MASHSVSQSKQDLLMAAMAALTNRSWQGVSYSPQPENLFGVYNHHFTTYSYAKVGTQNASNTSSNNVSRNNRNKNNYNYSEDDKLEIQVFLRNGEKFTLQIGPKETIQDLKRLIHDEVGIQSNNQRLLFNGRQLEDGAPINVCGIHDGSVVHLSRRDRDVESNVLNLSNWDSPYDYDFTNISDRKRSFERGGVVYIRPCGWQRFALKVADKFENTIWLGHTNQSGEWPVSYHGTGVNCSKTIAQDGFEFTKGKQLPFQHGVYSTPDPSLAEKYAVKFSHAGAEYKVMLQNRVNPENLETISATESGIGEYWINPSEKDIRPYAICIKNV